MDAFTDIGWFLYISLDSYIAWMHLQTLDPYFIRIKRYVQKPTNVCKCIHAI